MNRFYVYFAVTLLSLLGFVTKAEEYHGYTKCTYTVDVEVSADSFVDGQCLYTVRWYNPDLQENVYVDLNVGENPIEVIVLEPTDGTAGSTNLVFEVRNSSVYTFDSMKVQMASESTPSEYNDFTGNTYCSVSIVKAMDGAMIYPTVKTIEELRTATAYITIEDASKMGLRCGSYEPAFTSGENTIKFNPKTENQWVIGPKNYGEYLGGVTLNGNAITESYGRYYLTVANGDRINVVTTPVVEMLPVTISFDSEEARGAVTAVSTFVHTTKTPIDNWESGFTVPSHTQIVVDLNKAYYNITSLKVNGAEQSLPQWSEFYWIIEEASTISINAAPYATRDVVLDIQKPDQVDVLLAQNSYGGGEAIPGLVAGEQTIQVSESYPYFNIQLKSGNFFDEVTLYKNDGTTESIPEGYTSWIVPNTDVTKVVIRSHAKVRDNNAILWLDQVPTSTFMLQRQDYSYIFYNYSGPMPEAGYNEFSFSDDENPFALYYYIDTYANNVYLNGEKVSPKYDGSTSFEITLANNDVLKVFLGETPELKTVNFSGTFSDCVVDRVKNVSDLTDGIQAFPGTEISFKTSGEHVYVDDTELTPDADGKYTLTVSGNHSVSNNIQSSVENIEAAPVEDQIFDLTGRRLTNKNLPAGIYIINGKKIVVK